MGGIYTPLEEESLELLARAGALTPGPLVGGLRLLIIIPPPVGRGMGVVVGVGEGVSWTMGDPREVLARPTVATPSGLLQVSTLWTLLGRLLVGTEASFRLRTTCMNLPLMWATLIPKQAPFERDAPRTLNPWLCVPVSVRRWQCLKQEWTLFWTLVMCTPLPLTDPRALLRLEVARLKTLKRSSSRLPGVASPCTLSSRLRPPSSRVRPLLKVL